jgi:arginyl-tRNA synthetase
VGDGCDFEIRWNDIGTHLGNSFSCPTNRGNFLFPLFWGIFRRMRGKIEAIIKKVVGADAAISVPEKENFGHFSTNVAMRLAKAEGKGPLELAKELAGKIASAAPGGFFEKVEAVPPGFINFWCSKETIQSEFAAIQKQKDFGKGDAGKGKTIIVEYSQPNIGKMLHVGHLRTTIIGDALANIFECSGYEVIRWNYLGDWGTQFGKLITAYKLWGDKKTIKANPLHELQKLYVRFHEEMGNDALLEARGQEEFKKLENGDKENRKLWEWFKKESLGELEKIYTTLGVRFDTYIGESFYEKELGPLVAGLLESRVAVKSGEAVIIPLDGEKFPPALIQKSDGASLYLTRDIANLRYRLEKYKPAKILYVVGNEQSLHFEQLFAVAKILKMDSAELRHVKYGLVLGESGQKLATREGRTILLKEVLEKSIHLAREVVETKNLKLKAEDKDKIAEAVGIGALKYNDLKENRNSDIVFNWEKMLDFTGDSAPYLQYTYARMRSILRKAGRAGKLNAQLLQKDIELELIRKIAEFPDEVARSGENLATSNLANYLYKLAVLMSRLYETTPVIKEESAERRNALLALITIAAETLKKGLGLLGIKAVEEI